VCRPRAEDQVYDSYGVVRCEVELGGVGQSWTWGMQIFANEIVDMTFLLFNYVYKKILLHVETNDKIK